MKVPCCPTVLSTAEQPDVCVTQQSPVCAHTQTANYSFEVVISHILTEYVQTVLRRTQQRIEFLKARVRSIKFLIEHNTALGSPNSI